MFHIVLSADENYIKYASVLITSIIKHTSVSVSGNGGGDCMSQNIMQNADRVSKIQSIKDKAFDKMANKGYHFHVLSDTLSPKTMYKLELLQQELSKIYLCKIETHIVSDEMFKNLNIMDWNQDGGIPNYMTYYRLLLGRFVPKEVEVCLYLDVDMMAVGDIRELFSVNLSGKILGAVYHPYYQKYLYPRGFGKNIPINLYTHFTASLMLVNLIEWRERDIEAKCFELMKKYISGTADQDYLNIAIGADSIKLPYKWNCYYINDEIITCNDEVVEFSMPYSRVEYESCMNDLRIIHYCSAYKPWSSPYTMLVNYKPTFDVRFHKEWWEMALQTPIFKDELEKHKLWLENNELQCYANALSIKLMELDTKISKMYMFITNPHKAFLKVMSKVARKIKRS